MYSRKKQVRMLKHIRDRALAKYKIDKSLPYIDQCRWLFENYPDTYSTILKVGYTLYAIDAQYVPPFKYLVDWIDEQTPLLRDQVYGLNTKLHWIFNGLVDFPECANPECHNKIGIGINVKVNRGYPQYCCNRCAQKDALTIKKVKATKLKNHGNENYVNIEKIRQTSMDYYGVPWPFMAQEVIEKSNATKRKHEQENPNYRRDIYHKRQQTNILNGHEPNWNNKEKAAQTRKSNLEKNPHYYDSAIQSAIQTNIERYGGLFNPQKAKQTREKHKQENPNYYADIFVKSQHTKKIKYGDEHYMEFGSQSFYAMMEDKHGDPHWNNPEKNAKTCLERYGSVVFMPYGSQKFKDRMVELYGVEHSSQCHNIRLKQQQAYAYDGRLFGSSWELALYIWLVDSKIDFQYQPDIDIWYEFDGKQHRYEPDFMIEGKLVEVKGDHFFNRDGVMRCPYRKKTWTDEQYQHKCAQYEAKHRCMLKNNVQILLQNDCKKYIDYVEQTYGKDYLKQFKKKSK